MLEIPNFHLFHDTESDQDLQNDLCQCNYPNIHSDSDFTFLPRNCDNVFSPPARAASNMIPNVPLEESQAFTRGSHPLSHGEKLFQAAHPNITTPPKKLRAEIMAKARDTRNLKPGEIKYREEQKQAIEIIFVKNNITFPTKPSDIKQIIKQYNEGKPIDNKYMAKINIMPENCAEPPEVHESDSLYKGRNILSELNNLLDCNGAQGHRPSEQLKKTSFTIYNSSPKTYNLLRELELPFPHPHTLENHTQEKIHRIEQNLTKESFIDRHIQDYIATNAIKEFPLYVNIGIDAMCVEGTFLNKPQTKLIRTIKNCNEIDELANTIFNKFKTEEDAQSFINQSVVGINRKETCEEEDIEMMSFPMKHSMEYFEGKQDELINYVFLIMLLPVDPRYPKYPLHIIGSSSSIITSSIKDKMKMIIAKLTKFGIISTYISSDGDRSFDQEHFAVFQRYHPILQSPFYSLVQELSQYNIWVLSDMLHLLKIATSRIKKKQTPILY